MKQVTLTVEIQVSVNDDIEPNDITFKGIEEAIPQVDGKDIGKVESYCTQEYFE